MRILFLATDAFGGRGGIALLSRQMMTTFASHPDSEEIVAIPRHIVDPPGALPRHVRMVPAAARGKVSYAMSTFRELIRNRRFDLIVAAHINLLPLAWMARFWTGGRLVLLLHGVEAWAPGAALTRFLLQSVDATVAVSEHTAGRFRQWSPHHGREFVIHPTAELSRFSPGARNPELMKKYGLAGKRVLLTVGRLESEERRKGFDEVLEVLAELPEDVVYLVIGEGPDRTRLEAKARAHGVANRVVFTGYVAEEAKPEHYRLADVYVMPSRGEGFGLVILEALASGLPVIASRADGTREATRDGRLGRLVDPTDRGALRQSILESLQLPREVAAGLQEFSFENFQRRCHTMIDRVLEENDA